MSELFHTLFYNPLYNALVYLIDILPHHDVGTAVILLTVFVSILLFSLSKKSVQTQMKMQELQPELDRIKAIENKEEQARQMIDLYKKHKINPFSMIGLLLIQIPIFIALSYVFFRGGLPMIKTEILYSFVNNPPFVDMIFLGTDIAKRSILFAILASATHFMQARIALPKVQKKENATLKDEFAHSMNIQARYTMPAFTLLICLGFPSAVALYFITRNVFVTLQELFIKRKKVKK